MMEIPGEVSVVPASRLVRLCRIENVKKLLTKSLSDGNRIRQYTS